MPTKPSKYALPAKGKRASEAHRASRPRPRPATARPVRLRPARVRLPARACRTAATSCRPGADALVRARAGAATLGAPQRARLGGRRRAARSTSAEPEPVPTARATIVAASAVRVADEAAGWLTAARRRRGARRAPSRVLNRALRAYRAATADPYVARGLPRPRAGGAARLRQRRRGGRRPLRRGLRAAAPRRRAGAARWRRPRSASPPCSAAARRCHPARSWCCGRAPTWTPGGRARRRSRCAWRSRRSLRLPASRRRRRRAGPRASRGRSAAAANASPAAATMRRRARRASSRTAVTAMERAR